MSVLMHAFRRAWKLALPIALVGALATAAVAWLLVPPQFTSAIVFRIATRPSQGSIEDEGNFANVQKAQIASLKSHDILVEAIQQANTAEQFGVSFSPIKLQKQLVTQFNDGPEMLNVALSNENSEAAAALLNALGDVYPKKVNEAEETRIKNKIVQLRRRLQPEAGKDGERIPTLAEQLRDKRIELAKAEKEAGLDDNQSVAAKFVYAQTMLQASQRQASDMKVKKTGLEADLTSKLDRLDKPIDVVVTDGEVEDFLRIDPDYADLLKEIAAKKKQIEDYRRIAVGAELQKRLATPQAELRQLNSERKRLIGAASDRIRSKKRSAARDQLEKEIADLRDKVERAKKEDVALDADVKHWAIEVEKYRAGGPKAPANVEALRDQVRQLEKEHNKIGDELASLEGALPYTPRITRHTEAFVPTEKEYNRPLKYSAAAGFLTFGFLLVGMCLLEARSRRVYASDDVLQGLGMRVVGTVPLLPGAARKKSVQANSLGGLDSQFGLTEAIDAIRTVLLHAPRIDGARIVMITSATGGEGKTTLASHLAASLARAWRKTLLIDGDLRNPEQHKQFDQAQEPGFCEAIRGEVEFDDVVRPTLVSRLWLLPAGKVDAHALQALAQEGVKGVFDRLKEQYDFIVLDTSPVLPVPDALLFGQQADAVLLSVLKDHSRIPAVYQAHQRLETLGIRILGSVVIGEKIETYGHAVPYPKS
jgi:capsular exopolysaccharide synthesis family protein